MSVLLLFPPATEARLFPYLSLPMLTAYLRKHGIPTCQRDLNLDLTARITTPEVLRQVREGYISDDLYATSRRQLADYLIGYHDVLAEQSFGKKGSQAERSRAVRFMRLGADLVLESSILSSVPESLSSLGALPDTHDNDVALAVLDQLLDEVMAENPALLGISIAFFSQLAPSIHIARAVKKRSPDTTIILGGQQIMLRHRELARLEAIRRVVDVLAFGAGEETLLQAHDVVLGRATRNTVPATHWLADGTYNEQYGQVSISECPPPDFDGLRWREYLNSEVQLPLLTCVGCFWGRCVFCSYGHRSRRLGYQQKGAAQLADECRVLLRRYGIRRINFVDEMSNTKVVANAVQKLAEDGTHIQFSVRTRFEPVLTNRAFCRRLADLGCVLISAGYETNQQRLLDKLNKGVRAQDYQPIIDNLRAVGITLRLSILGGIPGETPEEEEASLAFLERNAGHIGIDTMQMVVAEPETPLAEHPETFGIYLRETMLRGNALLNYGGGRMGAAFEYDDGDSFDARLQRFLRVHERVNPRGNDELPPSRRRAASERINGERVRLHPWIAVVPSEDLAERVVIDLLWQRFYRLPVQVSVHGRELHSDRKTLEALVQADVGVAHE